MCFLNMAKSLENYLSRMTFCFSFEVKQEKIKWKANEVLQSNHTAYPRHQERGNPSEEKRTQNKCLIAHLVHNLLG